MDKSQNTCFQAGQAKGQTQEKTSNLMEKAGNAGQSAKETCLEAGKQVPAKAQGAANTAKDAVGLGAKK
ncbi:ABA-inducible protein [Fagus crenata]